MMSFGQICCACKDGAVIPRWQNVTKVYRAAFTSPSDHTLIITDNNAPFNRLDPAEYDGVHSIPACNTLPPGECGAWLGGGDIHAPSAQEVQDTVDDILGCGSSDSTHASSDHNCYLKNGDTVDMRSTRRFGSQRVGALHFWMGVFGWKSNDACAKDPNIGADQVKYRTYSHNASWSNTATSWDGTAKSVNSGSYSGTDAVNRLSGIRTNSLSISQDSSFDDPDDHIVWLQNRDGAGFTFDGANTTHYLSNMPVLQAGIDVRSIIPPNHNIGDFYCDGQSSPFTHIFEQGYYPVDGLDKDGNHFDKQFLVSGTADGWSCNGEVDCYYNPSNDGVTWVKLGTTKVSITYVKGDTSASYGYDITICDYVYSSIDHDFGSFSAGLSDPYTATDCRADWEALLGTWDMGDFTLAALRTDELLAAMPFAVYDCPGLIQPLLEWSFTMDDLSGSLSADANGNAPGSVSTDPGQHDSSGRSPGDPGYSGGVDYITTWPQRPWIDPQNFTWRYPNGSLTPPSGFTGGASIITPLRTGEAISHNQAGSDAHFWFNFQVLVRQINDDLTISWAIDSHGGYTPAPLPPVAMRWQTKLAAQWDAFAPSAQPGNLPDFFCRQGGGGILGAKFVKATQTWRSVNYARPCGPDGYAMDQTTACCILSVDDGSYTVRATGNAALPLGTGGIQVGDTIIATGDDSGVFVITVITDLGEVDDGEGNLTHQFTVEVGAKVDDLPTGGLPYGDARDSVDWLGRARFWGAPGICGRAAITTAHDSGTGVLTITPEDAQIFLRGGSVDIYDDSMTLISGGIAITRVDDSTFIATHAAAPDAAWMTVAGVDWTKNNSSPKQTAVHLDYSFNQRAGDPDFVDPPAWYADAGGCTGASVTQFVYNLGACRAMVGVVPYGEATADTGDDRPSGDDTPPVAIALESFGPNTVLFPPGDFAFDDVFGAVQMATVALTMADPFWQRPFIPDCGIVAPDAITWTEDDGTGIEDYEELTESGDTIYHKFWAHRPLVEASSSVPSGMSLPSGVSLYYANEVAPPFYPNGIPIGDDGGDFASVETDWGFAARVCANPSSRFYAYYRTFVAC